MTQLIRKLCLSGVLAAGLALSGCQRCPTGAEVGQAQADAGLAGAPATGAGAGGTDAGAPPGHEMDMDGGMAHHMMPDGGMMAGMDMDGGAPDAGTAPPPRR